LDESESETIEITKKRKPLLRSEQKKERAPIASARLGEEKRGGPSKWRFPSRGPREEE